MFIQALVPSPGRSLLIASEITYNTFCNSDPVGKREGFSQNSFKTLPDVESYARPITVAWERKYACCFKLVVGLSSSSLIAQRAGLEGFPQRKITVNILSKEK